MTHSGSRKREGKLSYRMAGGCTLLGYQTVTILGYLVTFNDFWYPWSVQVGFLPKHFRLFMLSEPFCSGHIIYDV